MTSTPPAMPNPPAIVELQCQQNSVQCANSSHVHLAPLYTSSNLRPQQWTAVISGCLSFNRAKTPLFSPALLMHHNYLLQLVQV